MKHFFELYQGGAVTASIVFFAFLVVAIKIMYELIATIFTKANSNFTEHKKRQHLSFLLMLTVTGIAQSYVLIDAHLDFFIWILSNSIMMITLLALCVSMYLLINYFRSERIKK